MKIHLLIIVMLLAVRSMAQDPSIVHYINDPADCTLPVPAVDISDCRVLDSAYMEATYRFHYRSAPEQKSKTTWVHLAIGRDYAKSYNDYYFRRDSLFTYKYKQLVSSYSCDLIPCEELIYRITDKKIVVFNRVINGPACLVVYEDSFPLIEWTVTNDTPVTISGYTCYKAIGNFGGREWTAWFAPDTPIPYGPWKLYGLPGLVIQAQEADGCYKFELIRIKQSKRPILWYECPYRNTTIKEWKKYERSVHRNPIAFAGEDVWYMYKGRRLDDSWSLPYNPLELE